jgi:DUF1680 family protein
MPVRQVFSNKLVQENENKLAIERGPLVYCAEGIDNFENVLSTAIPSDQKFTVVKIADLLGGINVIKGQAIHFDKSERGIRKPFTAIPYYAWAHRGVSEMAVWMPVR